jgi:hypothetical protein
MAIYETLYPQGNFLNIRANAPTQADYNIKATEDLVRNLPGGLLKDIISPAMAATLSLPYDTIQGISRADSYTPSGIMKSIAAENPLSSAYERFIGASAPLAERISDTFGMSKAEASDLGEVANLQSYTPNNLPFTSMSDMYNLSQRDLVDQINMGPRNINPPMTIDQIMSGSVLSNNIASPRTVLNQQTGIMQQAPQGIFNDFYGSVYEPYNEEKDDEQVDYLPGQSSFKDKISNIGSSFMQKSGIGGLLGLITGNPILGLIGKGIGALANRAGPALNDFKSASTGAQFFQNLRDRRAREDAAARGLAKQQEIARQTAIQAMTTNQAYGGGGGGGGIGSSVGGSASPGSAGPGGSDSMGSF